MRKTNVYVDAFNVYYGCLKGTPFKWLDVRKLVSLLLPDNEIVQIKYFTALVSSRPDRPGSDIRQLAYLRALSTIPNLEVIKGHYLSNKKQYPTFKSHEQLMNTGKGKLEYVEVMKTDEKGSDVNLATHLLFDGCRSRFECAVVISNDSDLKEPIRIVKEELNIPVGIINPGHENQSVMLSKVASFIKKVRFGALLNSQFSSPMKDAKGDVYKPQAWGFDAEKVKTSLEKINRKGLSPSKSYKKLLSACVTHFDVRLGDQETTYYGIEGSWVAPRAVGSQTFSSKQEFSIPKINSGVDRWNQGKITYSQFLKCLCDAGVHKYHVNFISKTAVYLGAADVRHEHSIRIER